MRRFTYPAELLPEKKGQFTIRFPDLPEAITSGTGRADAIAQAADCLEESIAARITDGLEIPYPSAATPDSTPITLSGSMAVKAALYLVMRESSLTKAELAVRLGVDEKEVRRMLDPRHATKLPRIEQALGVLGKRIVVSLESDAA